MERLTKTKDPDGKELTPCSLCYMRDNCKKEDGECWELETYKRLAQFEDMFTDRTFWIIHYIWKQPAVIPVTVERVNNGCLDLKWQITEEYSETLEEIEITELYSSEGDAWQVVRAKRQELEREAQEETDG